MVWSFMLPCWLTGHDEPHVLGPGAGGTAFLNLDAFSPLLHLSQLSGCSHPVPAPFPAAWLCGSAHCLLETLLHCWAYLLQHQVAILAACGRQEPPGSGLRAGGWPMGIPPWPS